MTVKNLREYIFENYPNALKFIPDCRMTQIMCDKAVNTHPSTIQFVLECYRT